MIGWCGSDHVFEENFCFGLVPVCLVIAVSAAGINEMHVGPPAHFFADVGGDDNILKKWIFAHKP